MKTCTKCGLTDSEVEFRTLNQCKPCRKAYMNGYLKEYSPKYYRENKAEVNRKVVDLNKERRTERYADLAVLKSVPCMDCKTQYDPCVMDFDDRDPTTKTADVGEAS